MPHYFRTTLLIALFVAALLSGLNLAWAAPLPPAGDLRTDIEAQNRRARQEEQDRRQREQSPDVFLQKGKQGAAVTKLPDETPSFAVRTILLEGDPTGRYAWLQDIAQQYAGQKVGRQGINIIVKTLTEALIDRGYITTRVLVPEQDLSGGALTLQLIPGVIKDIRVTGGSRADWRSAFPVRPGDILNLRDLEQGLEQMKRVPSQDADIQLVPGDEPGETIVAIAVRQTKPWKLILSLDDSGSEPTGKLQASETFSWDNPFGRNDLFHISLNSDADREGSAHGTRGDSFYYSFPQGYWTYTLARSSYKYHQTIPYSGDTFLSSGESSSLEMTAEKLIHRNQSQKTSLAFSLIKARSRSYINDTEIEGQRRETTAAQLALTRRQYDGPVVLDCTFAYKRGVPWFGAQSDPAAASPDMPTTTYNIWTLNANLTVPVRLGAAKARYNATLCAQYTKDRLYGMEFLSLGNRYTVRGFDGEETLAAETGWYLRNELSIPIANSGQEAYLGLDLGGIAGPSADQSAGNTLAGAVVGLRGQLGQAQYDTFIGWPVKKPGALRTAVPAAGFQLIYQL